MKRLAVGATVALAVVGCSAPDSERSDVPRVQTHATTTSSGLPALADLPVGGPPDLSHLRAVRRGFSGGVRARIERGTAIVLTVDRHRERQPLPPDCCTGARVVGVDVDTDRDLYVATDEGAWMWDAYEGNEGSIAPAPDSEDWLWPIDGLGRGSLVATGAGSELLVRYPGSRFGWGYVAGPRNPASDDPVRYEEQERILAPRVWLTSRAIVAIDPGGRLVALESDWRDDQGGHTWRVLTGGRSVFALPDSVEVDRVVPEHSLGAARRWTVLARVTDQTARTAWVRCFVASSACEIARWIR